MAVLSLVNKNIKDNKIILLILVIILVALLYYQFMYMNTNVEGFTVPPTPTPTGSPKNLFNNIYFINNFPKQNFEKVWEGKLENNKYLSFWQRNDDINYYSSVGQIAFLNDIPSSVQDLDQMQQKGLGFLVKGGKPAADFERVWENSRNRDQEPMSVWKIIPPEGYVALSDIVVKGYGKPSPYIISCLPKEIVSNKGIINNFLWKTPTPVDKTSSGEEISPPNSVSFWNIGSYGYFFAKDSYQPPINRSEKVFTINQDILNNQEEDPNDSGTYLKVTLQI